MSENIFYKLRDDIENGIVTGEFEPGERLDETPVPAGAAESGAVGRLVLHDDLRVVDRVQGEDRDGHLAGEVAVVGQVTACGGVGRESSHPCVERLVVV